MTDGFPVNAGLIQDELLGEFALASRGQKPASPATVQAVSSIIEAVVLHNVLYYRPTKLVTPPDQVDVDALIDDNPLVRELIRAQVLLTLPPADTEAAFEKVEGAHSWGLLLTDYVWQPDSFLSLDITSQRNHYLALSFLLTKYPTAFEHLELTDRDGRGQDVPIVEAAAILISKGMPMENLVRFEGWNHRAAALVKLARCLNLNLYVVDTLVPHQLGLNEHHNTKSRELYEQVVKEAITLEYQADVGNTDYATMRLPAFAQLALQCCCGDLTALADSVLDLREKHAPFRRGLTDFDRAWSAASTRRERIKLQAEFKNAIEALTKEEVRPRERLIYKTWDMFKKPLSVLEKVGDKLADRGRFEQVIGQVRGLRKFWTDLLDAPVAKDDEQLIATSFGKVAGRDVWMAGRDFAGAMNRRWPVTQKP